MPQLLPPLWDWWRDYQTKQFKLFRHKVLAKKLTCLLLQPTDQPTDTIWLLQTGLAQTRMTIHTALSPLNLPTTVPDCNPVRNVRPNLSPTRNHKSDSVMQCSVIIKTWANSQTTKTNSFWAGWISFSLVLHAYRTKCILAARPHFVEWKPPHRPYRLEPYN